MKLFFRDEPNIDPHLLATLVYMFDSHIIELQIALILHKFNILHFNYGNRIHIGQREVNLQNLSDNSVGVSQFLCLNIIGFVRFEYFHLFLIKTNLEDAAGFFLLRNFDLDGCLLLVEFVTQTSVHADEHLTHEVLLFDLEVLVGFGRLIVVLLKIRFDFYYAFYYVVLG